MALPIKADASPLPQMTFTFGCDCYGTTRTNSLSCDLKRAGKHESVSNLTLSTCLDETDTEDVTDLFDTITFHRHRAEMASNVIVERGILSPERLEEHAKTLIPGKCHRSNIFVVTDAIVDPLLGYPVVAALKKANLSVFKVVVSAENEDVSGESSGERSKTLHTLSGICDEIIAIGLDKHSCIVSLGGGVVNNLCGVVASLLYRGITLVHFPTTMMAQADAAIDFKQAVNHPMGKNLLGTYYPASTIVCDPAVLSTLSKRHVLNGLAECIKHGICHDQELLDSVLKCSVEEKLLAPAFLDEVIRRTITLKAQTLTEYDSSDFNEMAPQYGHAVGHAVEHLSWKKALQGGIKDSESVLPLLHGEACAIGMCVSAEISFLLGCCNKDTVDEHYRIFKAVGLPCIIPSELETSNILKCLTFDKHFVVKPTMGLVRRIGVMQESANIGSFSFSIEPDTMEEALRLNRARTARAAY
jgi:3-dehydroquinate synthase